MYTTATDYETYTSTTAPAYYERQELYATTLFKSIYPNFPSEDQFTDLDEAYQTLIEYAIFEQIAEGVSYSGTVGGADTFSVGNFSITDGSVSASERVSFMAKSFLDTCGVTYKGVGTC